MPAVPAPNRPPHHRLPPKRSQQCPESGHVENVCSHNQDLRILTLILVQRFVIASCTQEAVKKTNQKKSIEEKSSLKIERYCKVRCDAFLVAFVPLLPSINWYLAKLPSSATRVAHAPVLCERPNGGTSRPLQDW